MHQIVVVAKKMIKKFWGINSDFAQSFAHCFENENYFKSTYYIHFFSKESAPSSYHECFERSIRGKMAPLIYTANSGLKMEKLV